MKRRLLLILLILTLIPLTPVYGAGDDGQEDFSNHYINEMGEYTYYVTAKKATSGYFNVVSCRHSEFSAKEVAKVLVKGGTFLTQQVSENDKSNIKEAFGRGQAFGTKAGTLKQQYITELREAGFSDIQSFEYSFIDYYQTTEDLIFLLKHTPIIPDFGRSEIDFQILQQFIKEKQTQKGIKTNSERFIIVAKL